MNTLTAALIAELEALLNHEAHLPLNGPCPNDCVEKAVRRRIEQLESQ